MQSLLNRNKQEEWEAVDFTTWAEKDLKNLAELRTMESATPTVKAFLAQYGLKTIPAKLRTMALQALQKRDNGQVFCVGSHFTQGWANGGTIKVVEAHKQDQIVVPASLEMTVEGKKEVIPITPVQLLTGETDRKGLRFLAPIIASWFKIDNKEIVLAFEPKNVDKVCNKSQIDHTALPIFYEAVLEVFVPKTLHLLSGGKTLAGYQWFQHVKHVLSTCTFADYYGLHTGLVCDILKGRPDKNYFYAKMKVNESMPVALKETIQVLEQHFQGCYVMVAPLLLEDCPVLNFIMKKNNKMGKEEGFARARAGMQQLRALLSQSLGTYRLLEDARGYTTMMSESERDVVFLASTTLALLEKKKKVQIQLDSTGLLSFLFTSIKTWTKAQENPDAYEFKFILPSSSITGVQTIYAAHCQTTIDPEMVLVWIHRPDVSADTELADAIARSGDVFKGMVGAKEYIVKTAIYGSLLTVKTHNIFRYGTAWEFKGIISTFPTLDLMAQTASGKYYVKNIPKITGDDLATAWYNEVKTQCNTMLVCPYRGFVYASEICNVVYGLKEKMKVSFTPKGEVDIQTLGSEAEVSELKGFDPEQRSKPKKTISQIMAEAKTVEKNGIAVTATAGKSDQVQTPGVPDVPDQSKTGKEGESESEDESNFGTEADTSY